jgi:hypothetical protein
MDSGLFDNLRDEVSNFRTGFIPFGRLHARRAFDTDST